MMTKELIRHFISDYYKGDRSDHLRYCLVSAREYFNIDPGEEMSFESLALQKAANSEKAWEDMIDWLEKNT